MNYLPWVSNAVYGGTDAGERANYFLSWGIMGDLAFAISDSLFLGRHMNRRLRLYPQNSKGIFINGSITITSPALLLLLSLDWPLLTTLVPVQSTGSPNYTRNTTAIFIDHDSKYQTTLAGEVSFIGTRKVENLLSFSDDFSRVIWTKGGTASITGTNIINFPAINDQIRQEVTGYILPQNNKFVNSIYLSGSGTVELRLVSFGIVIIDSVVITLTATPTRYTVSGTFNSIQNGSPTIILVRSAGLTATTITASFAQLQEKTGASDPTIPDEYISADVLSTPYHGANVDGVKYFETENGNTVTNNIVTEAVGTALTTLKGANFVPGSVNKCTCYSIPNAPKLGSELTSGSLVKGKLYEITAQNGEDFTADGAADNNVGTRFVATGTSVTLDANDKVKEVGGTNSLTGAFVSGLGYDSGIDAGTKAYHDGSFNNPIPGMVLGADTAAVLSIIDDQTALNAYGKLDALANHGTVYELDNSGGGGNAFVQIAGVTGNTNTHTIHVFARGEGILKGSGGGFGDTLTISGAAYASYELTGTPNDGTIQFQITCSAGDSTIFLVPQLEEQAYATDPIITNGAAFTRNKTELSIQTTKNLPTTGVRHIKFNWTPKGIESGVAQCLWATRSDANNYLAIWADGVDIWIEKMVASTSTLASLAVAAAVGTTYQIDAYINTNHTLNLYVDDVVDDTNDSDTTTPVYGATMEYGSLNGISNAYCNFSNHEISNR